MPAWRSAMLSLKSVESDEVLVIKSYKTQCDVSVMR